MDLELLRAWREGDQSSGKQLFERHFATVYRYFANKAPAAADDLVQETFLACVRGRDRFRGDSTFRTYVLRIARNLLWKHRKRGGDSAGPLVSSQIADPVETASTLLTGREQVELLRRALRHLELDQQTLLELRYWEGMPSREIAVILDVPASTVRSRLTTARARLRSELERVAATPSLLRSTFETLERWEEIEG